MAEDQHQLRNQIDGEVRGTVVQARMIDHVWMGAVPTHGDVVARGLSLVPRQLPPVIRDFTGRAEHVAALDALLPAGGGDMSSPPQMAVITAIDGTAGIGKTTLAVWWAHRVQHEFPDGTLYVNLRGYGPGDLATTTEVLDGFLRALGIPQDRMPAGVEAQAGLLRSLLAGRRVLIVLDNARHAEQVRPLLPGTPGCVVVVTSRDSLTGLVVTEGASRLTLDLLSEREAVQLVAGVLGRGRTSADPDALTELVRWCARLPLALRIAAGRAAAYPHSTVTDVVAELADERGRLDILSRVGDDRAAMRAVFDSSYQHLSAEQARVFRSLGLHPGPEVSVRAAAAVSDSSPSAIRRVLEELAQIHLIEPVGRERYRFHDLLRAYALDQATRQDSADDLGHAQLSLLSWYAHTARTCDILLFPAFTRLPQPVAVPEYPTPIYNLTDALAWLVAEQDNLMAALRYAARHGLHQQTLHLADSLRFLSMLGSWDAAVEAGSCGLSAAQQSEEFNAEGWFLCRRGEVFVSLRRWDDAQADFDRLWELSHDHDDRLLRYLALSDLGHMSIELGHFGQGLSYLEQALPLSRGIDAGRIEAVVECNVSRAYAGLRQYRRALDHAEIELSLRRRCGDFTGEAGALLDLARAWQGLGEHQKAIRLCRESISRGRTVGNFAHTVAEPLDTLAMSLHKTGDTFGAIVCWEEAAAIFGDRGLQFEADQVRDRARAASDFQQGTVVPHPCVRQ